MNLIVSVRGEGRTLVSQDSERIFISAAHFADNGTGDHVDILGRSSLNDLILRVAGGQGHLIEDSIQSNIREYADKVKIYDDGEEGERRHVPP
jgi:hypothetical protein